MRHTFYSGALAPSSPNDMNVANLDTVCIQVSGSATSRSVYFYGSVDGENYAAVMGLDKGTLAPSTYITSTTCRVIQFDTRCMTKLRMHLTVASGGDVTIKALGE